MRSQWRAPLALVGGGALVGLALIAALAFTTERNHVFAGVAQPEGAFVADFTLRTRADRAVRLADLRGRYVLVSYGYTFCPDVCPTTLAMLHRVMADLGAERDRVAVVFVSIDPERDTPDRTAEYVSAFGPDFIGLSGAPDQIAAAAHVFNVSYSRQEAPSSAAGYLMNHSAFVYLVDPEGRWRVTYPYGVEAAGILRDLEYLIAQDPV